MFYLGIKKDLPTLGKSDVPKALDLIARLARGSFSRTVPGILTKKTSHSPHPVAFSRKMMKSNHFIGVLK